MNSLVLDSETAKLPLEYLLRQLGNGGVEVKDSAGKIIAVILGPMDKEALTYAEANLDIDQHLDQVRQTLGRREGISTSQLLEKAALAAEEAAQE